MFFFYLPIKYDIEHKFVLLSPLYNKCRLWATEKLHAGGANCFI